MDQMLLRTNAISRGQFLITKRVQRADKVLEMFIKSFFIACGGSLKEASVAPGSTTPSRFLRVATVRRCNRNPLPRTVAVTFAIGCHQTGRKSSEHWA